ncbi:hypothetical protein D3C71_234460 [compost metagenome]
MAKETVLKLINTIKTMDAAANEMEWTGKYDPKYDLHIKIDTFNVDMPFSADAYCYISEALMKLLVEEADLDMVALKALGQHQWNVFNERGKQDYFITFEYRGQTIYNPFVMNGRFVDPIDYFGKSFLLSDWLTDGQDLANNLIKTANHFCEVTLINNYTGYERFKFGDQLYFEDAFRNFCVLAALDAIDHKEAWDNQEAVFESLIEAEYFDNLMDLLVQLTVSTQQFNDFSKVWDYGFFGFLNNKYSISIPHKKGLKLLFGFVGKGKELHGAFEEAMRNHGEKNS